MKRLNNGSNFMSASSGGAVLLDRLVLLFIFTAGWPRSSFLNRRRKASLNS
jgi:hypothetical protein